MKSVLFEMKIPKWAKWKSTDKYGAVWIWENRPSFESEGRYQYWAQNSGRFECIMQIQPPSSDGKNTLVEIKW